MTDVPLGSLVDGDVRCYTRAIRSGNGMRQRHLLMTDEEWAAVRSWAAAYDATPGQLILAVMRTWRRRKYPIEWIERKVEE